MPALPTAIRNQAGERLDFTYHPALPTDSDPRIVLIAHGVTSTKDRPYLQTLSQTLAANHIASLRFSFAGNGNSEGRYADLTITKELADLTAILDALPHRHPIYAGHSMGAAVGVLHAATNPRIRALISLAGMTHIQHFMTRTFGHLTPDRDFKLNKPTCPLTQRFLDDARAHHDTLAAAATIQIPWLLIHGTADELVPLADAHDAHSAANHRPDLIELPDADHRFTNHEQTMADAVVAWIRALPDQT